MEDMVRSLRSRDILVPAKSQHSEDKNSSGRHSVSNRSPRGSHHTSKASSRGVEERLELLRLQEQLALEEERAKRDREDEERLQQQEQHRLELERQEREAERLRRIAELRESVIRKEFETKRASLSGSRRTSQASGSIKSLSPTSRTNLWVQDQSQYTHPPEVAPSLSHPVSHPPPLVSQNNPTFPQNAQISQQSLNVPLNTPALDLPHPSWDAYFLRKAGGKDLPNFSGNPGEWFGFITQFNRSTKLCKFSDEENLVRLQKALTGRAKDAVRALLCVPGSVNDIIKSLELRYGRPQVIIHELMLSVKKFPALTDYKLSSIIDLYDTVNNLVVSIEALGCHEYLTNPQLLGDLVEKLTPNLKLSWGDEIARSISMAVNLKHFRDWLYNRSLSVTLAVPVTKENRDSKFKINLLESCEISNNTCEFCNFPNHMVIKCVAFKKETVANRRNWAKDNDVCYSCLMKNCRMRACKSSKRCGVDGCKSKHHPLLHSRDFVKKKQEPVLSRSNDSPADEARSSKNVITHSYTDNKVLLKILPVRLYGPKGSVVVNALLDDGATATLIDKRVANSIGVKGCVSPLCVQWINEVSSRDEESEVIDLSISGIKGRSKRFHIKGARTVESLHLPCQNIDLPALYRDWPNLSKLEISFASDTPKILIGQDNWVLLEGWERLRNSWNGLAVERTRLGWVLHGNIRSTYKSTSNEFIHVCQIQIPDDRLHEIVKNYFSLDSWGIDKQLTNLSAEDKDAINVIDKTARCLGNRWEVGLPWKNDSCLVDSRSAALRRLYCLEKKMDRDENFARQYDDKIQHYIDKNYARKLLPTELDFRSNKIWYLPHLAVFNINKPGKIRVVFDASAKVGGTSFNDALIKGPDLYCSIPKILMKFRQGQIAFSGDIKEMFLQIKIRKEDQHSQRFLWRGRDRSKEPDTYVMQVMLFGAVSSPFQAQEIRNRNAMRFVDTHPDAVKAVVENHYMDDYLDSADSIDEAVRIIESVRFVHSSGGFDMCNWVSNSSEVLEKIGAKYNHSREFNFDSRQSEKVLGMRWNPIKDVFVFRINYAKINPEVLNNDRRPTKREVLRLVMSIYDPLGLLSFYTIRAKILLQEIWRKKADWDETIDESIGLKWLQWLDDLKNIETVEIPRCFSPRLPNALYRDLHIFCDASDRAYSAAAYVRLECENGPVDVVLVAGKSKVAPLKQVSVPRLELQAALTAARLGTSVKSALNFSIRKTVFWSDSKTVIHWIYNNEQRYKMYVAHRIGEILDHSDPREWRWIPGNQNAADGGTKVGRGVDWRWILGPEFLKGEDSDWPEEITPTEEECTSKELIGVTVNDVGNLEEVTPKASRFSKWLKLVRSTAWVLRFIDRGLRRLQNPTKNLEPKEMLEADKLWWRKEQRNCFGEEIHLLNRNECLPKRSKLKRLTPFIDAEGILRVRGRLEGHGNVNPELNQPVILDAKSQYVSLMIDHYHHLNAHHGQERVVNELRQRFWIIGVRRAVRSAWSRCLYCSQMRTKPMVQVMGPLPASRTNSYCRPFTSCGIDYFGPLWVTVKRRKEKRYGLLFTCLTTRAVHLEVANDLTTDTTLLAIRRFMSRRGSPKEFWSDNALSFKGAEQELKDFLMQLDINKLKNDLANIGVKWIFIPPQAPHMGGCWERMVRSVKSALKAILKERAPREEVLHTVFTEIEHLINSRPLTTVSEDPSEPEALTPNHFLIGSSSGSPLWSTDEDTDLRKKWKESQYLTLSFWRRWLREYLPSLVKSTRWFSESPTSYVGQLVFLPEKNQCGKWTRGIITAVYPGKDKKIRVVDVKTEKGTFRRPITSLSPLAPLTRRPTL